MQLKNSEERYATITKLFHWVMALLILGMLVMGLKMVTLPMGPDKLWVYGIHKSTGIIILFLAFLRLSWRQVNYQPKIPEAKGIAPRIFKLMEFAAKTTHAMIYILFFAMPFTGWAMSNAYGFPVSVYGWFVMPNLVAPDKDLAKTLETIHDYGAYLLIALLVMHVGAALFHHFILKDIVLKRMLPFTLFIIALPVIANAAPVQYEVDKAKSSIKFEAVQNGAPVVGEFKDFTADIAFDPKDLLGSKAVVMVNTASIDSTYGEMVSTLKEGDWFDSKKFASAKFESEKFTLQGEKYAVIGKLTIRDKTQPVTLDCDIKLSGKNAIANCNTSLERTKFDIGWKDTSGVKDVVKVTIHIAATAK